MNHDGGKLLCKHHINVASDVKTFYKYIFPMCVYLRERKSAGYIIHMLFLLTYIHLVQFIIASTESGRVTTIIR